MNKITTTSAAALLALTLFGMAQPIVSHADQINNTPASHQNSIKDKEATSDPLWMTFIAAGWGMGIDSSGNIIYSSPKAATTPIFHAKITDKDGAVQKDEDFAPTATATKATYASIPDGGKVELTADFDSTDAGGTLGISMKKGDIKTFYFKNGVVSDKPSSSSDVNVSYDAVVTPADPGWYSVVPADVAFTDANKDVDTSVKLVNGDDQKTPYNGSKQVDVTVKSDNAYKLKDTAGDVVDYKLDKDGKNTTFFTADTTEQALGTLDKTAASIASKAHLTGTATKTGKYIDTLHYVFKEK